MRFFALCLIFFWPYAEGLAEQAIQAAEVQVAEAQVAAPTGGAGKTAAAQLAAPNISFKLQRSQPEGLEYFQVRYDTEFKVLQSSNTFCGPSAQVLLGEFKLPPVASLRLEQRKLQQVFVRLPWQSDSHTYKSPHSTRYFLKDRDVSDYRLATRSIKSALDIYCDTRLWKPQKAVQVQVVSRPKMNHPGQHAAPMMLQLQQAQLSLQYFENGKPSKKVTKSYAELKCRKVGRTLKAKTAVIECFIKDYGKALLTTSYLVL